MRWELCRSVPMSERENLRGLVTCQRFCTSGMWQAQMTKALTAILGCIFLAKCWEAVGPPYPHVSHLKSHQLQMGKIPRGWRGAEGSRKQNLNLPYRHTEHCSESTRMKWFWGIPCCHLHANIGDVQFYVFAVLCKSWASMGFDNPRSPGTNPPGYQAMTVFY